MNQLQLIFIFLWIFFTAVMIIITVFWTKRFFVIFAICEFVLGLTVGLLNNRLPLGIRVQMGIFLGLLSDSWLLGGLLNKYYRDKSIEILHQWRKDGILPGIFNGIGFGVFSTKLKITPKKTIFIVIRSVIQLFIVVAILYISPLQQHKSILSGGFDFPLRLIIIFFYLNVFWFINNILLGESAKSSRFLQFSNYQYTPIYWLWAIAGGIVAIGSLVGICLITKYTIAHFLPEWVKWTYIAILFFVLVGGWVVIRLTLDWISWYKNARDRKT